MINFTFFATVTNLIIDTISIIRKYSVVKKKSYKNRLFLVKKIRTKIFKKIIIFKFWINNIFQFFYSNINFTFIVVKVYRIL